MVCHIRLVLLLEYTARKDDGIFQACLKFLSNKAEISFNR